MPATVVLVLVLVLVLLVVVTVFEKCLKGFVNTQRNVTKLSIHIPDIIPARSTVLDFFTRWRHLPGP